MKSRRTYTMGARADAVALDPGAHRRGRHAAVLRASLRGRHAGRDRHGRRGVAPDGAQPLRVQGGRCARRRRRRPAETTPMPATAPTPGDVAGAVASSSASTSASATPTPDGRRPPSASAAWPPLIDEGRASHQHLARRDVRRPTAVLGAELAERAVNALHAATDVYTWKLLRRDLGLSRAETERDHRPTRRGPPRPSPTGGVQT